MQLTFKSTFCTIFKQTSKKKNLIQLQTLLPFAFERSNKETILAILGASN